MALSMEERHIRALSGTFAAVFTASTQERHAASMLSTSIWRVFSGLSHLQDTRMVGRDEFTSASTELAKRTHRVSQVRSSLKVCGNSVMLCLFITSYNNRDPSTRGTICPLICFGHCIRRSGLISKDSRSNSMSETVYVILSTDMRRLEAIDVGRVRSPSARCMRVLFPTPVAPIIAMLMSDIPLRD